MLGSKLGNYTAALKCFCDFVNYTGRDVNVRGGGGGGGKQCLVLIVFDSLLNQLPQHSAFPVSGTGSFVVSSDTLL
jgi:hypothetical protein